jgi:hypothetical protein
MNHKESECGDMNWTKLIQHREVVTMLQSAQGTY